jgi:hypothetical protein
MLEYHLLPQRSNMNGSPPETVLVEFEVGFFHFWLVMNEATSQIEKGTDPQLVAPILRQEVNQALNTIITWRLARVARNRDRPAA